MPVFFSCRTFFADFAQYYRFGKRIRTTLFDMSEEKKTTLRCHFFFLVGPILSSSEESWTKEYSECRLKQDITQKNKWHQNSAFRAPFDRP